jgi:Ca-activated chloride channel family protein
MMNFLDYTYADKWVLWFLLVIPLLTVWYIYRQHRLHPALQISTTTPFAKLRPSFKVWFRHSLFVLRMLAIALLIVALARPQSSNSWHNVTTKGIDIMMAMDVSGSMLAQDFSPNRLEAAKQVATRFINGRSNDRIGLVVFSGESFTQCPLTTDHAALINLMKDIKSGMIEDGTAIGEGLATSVARLKDSKAISKVIILLTDGVNNSGSIDPFTAAEIAKTFGIRVYTIGVGTYGMAPYPVQTPFGTQLQDMKVEIDEGLLKKIADMTDGLYFRANNKKKLEAIYQKIDKLEKSKISVKEYHKKDDRYLYLGLIALLALFFEGLLRYTYLKNTP